MQHPRKKASESWKTLGEGDKEPYLGPYRAHKQIYDRAFAEYRNSGKLDAWSRDPNKPRKPMTGFFEEGLGHFNFGENADSDRVFTGDAPGDVC